MVKAVERIIKNCPIVVKLDFMERMCHGFMHILNRHLFGDAKWQFQYIPAVEKMEVGLYCLVCNYA